MRSLVLVAALLAAPPVEEPGSDVIGTGDEAPPVTLPLVPVPVGCTASPLPDVVFVGRVDRRDQRSVTFEIESVRAGDPARYQPGNTVEIRYGLDAQYLDPGDRVVVSAPIHPDLGVLVSRVTPPIEDFGGDEVIGVSESDVSCPPSEDPAVTLALDGTPIAAGVLDPISAARVKLLGAILIPLALGIGAVFVLAALRLSVGGLLHSVGDVSRRSP